MQTHINKWGNSFGVQIPHALVEQLSLENELAVNIQLQDETTPVIKVAKKYDLHAMLEQITENNLHPLYLDSDDQQGEERDSTLEFDGC
jgi:antitoxin component of MazEF toxin-antitoxin module